MKIRDIPLFLLLMFTLVYSLIGDPKNMYWSGSYFLINYIIMFWLFTKEGSKLNRIIGMSLSISVILFVVLKFFLNLHCERYYTFVPFLISLYAIYKLETK